MTVDTTAMLGLAVLGSMKKAERTRAQSPLMLTLVPGPPATRAALATVAVSTQARDSVRRERRVAAAVVSAVQAVAAGEPASTAFAAQPALQDLAPDQLALQLEAGRGSGGERTPDPAEAEDGRLPKVLREATAMLIEAIGRPKGALFTREEAAEFADYLDLLPGDLKDQVVKPAEPV